MGKKYPQGKRGEGVSATAFALSAIGYTEIACARCGLSFGVTADFEQRRRNDHAEFYCPSGHTNYYPSKSDSEKLTEQLAAERARADRAEEGRRWAERNARGARIAEGMAKSAKKRLEHRVNCGVCPHCRRTFKQLADHIKTKHPNVVKK